MPMKTEDLKTRILKTFGNSVFYGYEAHKVFESEKIKMDISRLYRVLNVMLKEGLLESKWMKSRLGPKKRLYQLSEKGRSVLQEIFFDAVRTVHANYAMYLQNLAPKVNVFDQLLQYLTKELNGSEVIIFLTMQFTMLHQMMVQQLHSKVPRGKVYLIKPSALPVDLSLNNLLVLGGSYSDVPLKVRYADCLIVMDLPKKELLERAVQEWHRVLSNKGMLSIFTPTVLLERYEDPLSIGDFIEKHEHETVEHGVHINREIVEAQLKKRFNKIEQKTLVHMTILQVSEPAAL